jgi:hypothetical protein
LPGDLAIWWLLLLTMLSPFSLPRFFFSLPYCQLLAYTFSLVRFSGWYVNKSLIAELGLERKRERERGMKEMVLGIMTAQ